MNPRSRRRTIGTGRRRGGRWKPPPNVAFAVRYYQLADWPSLSIGQTLSSIGGLFDTPQAIDGIPRGTTFTPNDLWSPQEYQKLNATHERLKQGYSGPFTQRFRERDGDIQNSVTEHYDFSAYLAADRHGIYMRANRVISEGALRAVRDRHGIGFKRGQVNVKAFIERYRSEVQRAWFNNLNITNVQSVAIAGKNVGQSEDFSRYLDRGDLSAVQLLVEWRGHKHQVVISEANAIFFYMSDDSIAVQLAAYVNGILNELADVVQLVDDPQPASAAEESGPDLGLGYEVTQLNLSDDG